MKNTLYYRLDMKRQKNREKDEAGKPAKLTVLQLSWLERYTDNVEVGSSTLPGTTLRKGGLAQLARASALHAEGQRFESVILHRSDGNIGRRSLTCCTFSKVRKEEQAQ